MYWVFIANSNSWKVEGVVGLYLNSRERVELQPVSNSRVETKDRPEYSTDDEASPGVPYQSIIVLAVVNTEQF